MSETKVTNTAVILLGHGAPEDVKHIPEYLKNIRGGKVSSPEVVAEVTERYELLGGSSPFRKLTQEQAEALEVFLNQGGDEFKVYYGMRVWKPFIKDVVKQAMDDGAERIIAICLAPQYSEWSTERYWRSFKEALKDVPGHIPIHFITSWAGDPSLIDAFEERYQAAVEKMKADGVEDFHTVFTVHSIPEGPRGKEDPYVHDYNRTMDGLIERVNPSPWYQAFQSQGMIPVPWLEPSVEQTIDEIAEAGGKTVLIVPVGFVCDHVEILYDIDIAFKEYAEGKGLKLYRTESLNSSPGLIEALGAAVWERLI